MSLTVAKGRWDTAQGYIYTCGMCAGRGTVTTAQGHSVSCPCCYGLDLDRLLDEFATARGERYYALLKAILSIQGKAIVDRVLTMRSDSETGKLTPAQLLIAFHEFRFPLNRWKPFVEWLEETSVIRPGTYERMKDGNFKVRESMIKAGLIDEADTKPTA